MGVISAIRILEEFVETAKAARAKVHNIDVSENPRPCASPQSRPEDADDGSARNGGILEQLLSEAQRPLLVALNGIKEHLERLTDSKSQSSAPSGYLTVGQIVARTGRCAKTVRTWIKEGRLKASRWGSGRELRVRDTDLSEFLNAKQPTHQEVVNTSEQVRKVLAKIDGRLRNGRR